MYKEYLRAKKVLDLLDRSISSINSLKKLRNDSPLLKKKLKKEEKKNLALMPLLETELHSFGIDLNFASVKLDYKASRNSYLGGNLGEKIEAQRFSKILGQLKVLKIEYTKRIDFLESKYQPNTLSLVVFSFSKSNKNGETIDELSKVLSNIKFITQGFSRLENDNTPVRVLAIEKGSLIVTITTTTAIAASILGVIKLCLNVLKEFYEIKNVAIKHRQSEIEALHKNAEILMKSAKELPKKAAISIGDSVLDSYKNPKNEAAIHARKAIEKIIEHFFTDNTIEVSLIEAKKEMMDLKNEVVSQMVEIEAQKEEILQLDSERIYEKLLEEAILKD